MHLFKSCYGKYGNFYKYLNFKNIIKAATNAPRINLIGYVCCLNWKTYSVQYRTFINTKDICICCCFDYHWKRASSSLAYADNVLINGVANVTRQPQVLTNYKEATCYDVIKQRWWHQVTVCISWFYQIISSCLK